MNAEHIVLITESIGLTIFKLKVMLILMAESNRFTLSLSLSLSLSPETRPSFMHNRLQHLSIIFQDGISFIDIWIWYT